MSKEAPPLAQPLSSGQSTWIPCSTRMPDDGQNVAFVVQCPQDEWYHGRVLGGRYTAGQFGGFSVPGLLVSASYWMPLPDAPKAAGFPGEEQMPGTVAPQAGNAAVWHEGIPPERLHSRDDTVHELLVWVDDITTGPRLGTYKGGLMKCWRIAGSPSDWTVSHWAEILPPQNREHA